MRSNSGTATDVAAITNSDTVDVPKAPAVGLFIGTGGDVTIIAPGGGTATFKNLPNAYTLDVSVQRVLTSTTASDIVALY